MKETCKMIIFALAVLCMCAVPGITAKAEATGACGKTAVYVDDGKGTMTLSGTGEVDSLPSQVPTGGSEEIKKLIIGEGITEIHYALGEWIYTGGVEEVIFPSTIEDIGTSFSYTKIKEITLPSSIKELKKGAFKCCSELVTAHIEEGVVSIGARAFDCCTGLKAITIPSSVTKIGKNALQSTNELVKVVNKSKVACPLPTQRESGRKLQQVFYTAGKKVTSVAPQTTAKAKWNTYKVTLKLNGGKLVGKNLKKHTYNTSEKLPRAKKKGYVFFGWEEKGDGAGKEFPRAYISKYIYTNVTYKAIFKKVSVKKQKKKIKITLDRANLKNVDSICLKVADNKKMKNARIFDFANESTQTIKKNGIVCHYNSKKDRVTITLKKKAKKQYVKACWASGYEEDESVESIDYFVTKV